MIVLVYKIYFFEKTPKPNTEPVPYSLVDRHITAELSRLLEKD